MSLFHGILGLDLLSAFVGCVIIVVVSKSLGKLWLKRSEDHYDKHDR